MHVSRAAGPSSGHAILRVKLRSVLQSSGWCSRGPACLDICCHVMADAYCASKFAVEGLTEAMATTLPQVLLLLPPAY